MRRRPKGGAGRAVVVLVAVTGSLAVLAWRQSTTRETLEELDRVGRELAVLADRREELTRELVGIEKRPWVLAEASRRLRLRPASEREVILASGGVP